MKSRALLPLFAIAALLAGCAGGGEADRTEPSSSSAPTTRTPTPAPTPTPTPSATPTPTATPTAQTPAALPLVKVSCWSQENGNLDVEVIRETADFTQAWAQANGGRCEIPQDLPDRTVRPVTDLEKAVYAASGYTENNIGTIYGLCASVQTDNVLLRPEHVMSDFQVKETQAMLLLCPAHPQAVLLADKADISTNPERADELPVSDGKYVVGVDLSAGTYKTQGTSWEACYWARVQGDGTIIDNNFVTFAPEGVTVTVNDGEGFESSGCGPWNKIG